MYRLAAASVVFSAMVHGVAMVLGKFEADVLPLGLFVVFYLVSAVFLFKKNRLFVWLTLIVALIGAVVGLMSIGNNSAAPDNAFNATAMASFIVAACMCVVLWNSKRT